MRLKSVVRVLASIGLLATVFSGAFSTSATTAKAGPSAVPDQILVGFDSRLDASSAAKLHASLGATVLENIYGTEVQLVQVGPGLGAQKIAEYTKQSGVRFAEPNWIYTIDAVSNDPYYTNGSLWGMYGDATNPANQYGSQAGEAWTAGRTGSDSIYIGIIDEGFQVSHPDLDGNAWTNPYEAVDGVDNDGNGYVDDINGWDFAGNDNTVYDGGTQGRIDDHGTHVAGTIGAEGGNGTGVAGVNWNVTMISGKFLGRNGGTTANAIKAVNYFTDLKTRHGLNIVATNNSWGGGGFSQGLLDAINRGGNANILFIAAAGNGGRDNVGDNNDTTANYPSNYQCTNNGTRGWDCVIAVAAITSTGARASFSNYGATTVDLGAPGASIWSSTAYNTYSSYSGTSMATPHVSGAAALISSVTGATGAQLRQQILANTLPTASLSGRTVTGGRLDLSTP